MQDCLQYPILAPIYNNLSNNIDYFTNVNYVLDELTLFFVNLKHIPSIYISKMPISSIIPTTNTKEIENLIEKIQEIMIQDLNGFSEWKVVMMPIENENYLGIAHNQYWCLYRIRKAIEEIKKIYNERKDDETFLIGTIDIRKMYDNFEKFINILNNSFETKNEWSFSTATDQNYKEYICMIREDDVYEMEAMKKTKTQNQPISTVSGAWEYTDDDSDSLDSDE